MIILLLVWENKIGYMNLNVEKIFYKIKGMLKQF